MPLPPYRQVQPPPGVRINPAHQLSQGLQVAVVAPGYRNVVNGDVPTITNALPIKSGRNLVFDHSTSSWSLYSRTPYIGIPVTVAVRVYLSGVANQMFVSFGGGSGQNGWALKTVTGTDLGWTEPGSGLGTINGGSFSLGVPLDVTCTCDTGTQKIYVNGQVGSAAVSGTLGSPLVPTRSLQIGSGWNGSAAVQIFTGKLEFVYIWSRILTRSEVAWLYREPYAMFQSPGQELFSLTPPPRVRRPPLLNGLGAVGPFFTNPLG